MRLAHEESIKRLATMIANWHVLSDNKVVFLNVGRRNVYATPVSGLCANAQLRMDCPVLKQIINDWRTQVYGPGLYTGLLMTPYWIAGQAEFNEQRNLYSNTLRLHAAIYIRNCLIDVLNEDLK